MDEKRTKKIKSVRDLKVYRKAFDSAMEIFEITKKFPKEETYSLTDQIRRASRSVCSNLSEGWRKRRYKAVFLNKLTDYRSSVNLGVLARGITNYANLSSHKLSKKFTQYRAWKLLSLVLIGSWLTRI